MRTGTIIILAGAAAILAAQQFNTENRSNILTKVPDPPTEPTLSDPNTIHIGPGLAMIRTPLSVTIEADLAVVPLFLAGEGNLDFEPLLAGQCSQDLTFSLPGAAPGNSLAPGWPAALPNHLFGTMRVVSSGIVSVRLCADSTGPIDPPALTFGAAIVKRM